MRRLIENLGSRLFSSLRSPRVPGSEATQYAQPRTSPESPVQEVARENLELRQKKSPHPDEYYDIKGRELEGLPEKTERFSGLDWGEDLADIKINSNVTSDHDPRGYCVFVNSSGGEKRLPVRPPHWRTVTHETMATTEFTTLSGNKRITEPFFEANVKGVGFLKPSITGAPLDEYDTWTPSSRPEHPAWSHYHVLGIAPREEFKLPGGGRHHNDICAYTQHVHRAGLRTELYWLTAEMKNVYYKGQKRSVEELRQEGVLPRAGINEFIPYIGVRLLKTNDRIAEASDSEERRRSIFERAFEAHRREARFYDENAHQLDMGNREDQKQFMMDFFMRMGKNMAVLLNESLVHNFLHSANITMAAELADVSTLTYCSSLDDIPRKHGMPEGHIKDMRDVVYSLKKLLTGAKRIGFVLSDDDMASLVRIALDAFNDGLLPAKITKNGTNVDFARACFEAIIKKVLLEKQRLPALQGGKNSLEEWPIEWDELVRQV